MSDDKSLRTDHSKLRCPGCGSEDLEFTCIGIIGNRPDTSNRATCCSCHWKGKVPDCKQEKP